MKIEISKTIPTKPDHFRDVTKTISYCRRQQDDRFAGVNKTIEVLNKYHFVEANKMVNLPSKT